MLEPAQQSWQSRNPNTLRTELGRGLKEIQHPGLQVLADKMRARLINSHDEIDRDVFEVFCRRVLAVTFLDWMCKP